MPMEARKTIKMFAISSDFSQFFCPYIVCSEFGCFIGVWKVDSSFEINHANVFYYGSHDSRIICDRNDN